jgi:hypothetical protein
MTQQGDEPRFELRLLKKGNGIVVGEFGPVCIAVWREDSTRARFDIQKAGLAEVVAKNPGAAGFLCVVEPTSGAPNEEVRKASSMMFESHARDLRAIAMVIEGSGFRSAIVRSVASGIVMLMGSRTIPISYFANVENGAKWMVDYVALGDIGTIKGAVEKLRIHLR